MPLFLAMKSMIPKKNRVRLRHIPARSRDARFFFTHSTSREPISSPVTNSSSMARASFQSLFL